MANQRRRLWSDISEKDFLRDENIDDVDIADYDLEKMGIFTANVSYFRQFIRFSDSLKPVERRILCGAVAVHAIPGNKKKSLIVNGEVSKGYAHGDGALYQAVVAMSQPWKKGIPLIDGVGNFGNDAYPENYAHARYTEIRLSKYAYECFFSDYDPDCVETIFNSASSKPEPLSLPAKFPNVLVNGGLGMAPGNTFRIPPFNINDIVDMTKKLIKNPNYSNVRMVPDFPCGCLIVDDGIGINQMCDTGKGTIKLRAKIDIVDEGKQWSLQIRSLPWLTSLSTIEEKLVTLTKQNILPIKDIQGKSDPEVDLTTKNVRTQIDHRVIIDKAHDPYQIREKLYKMTDLEVSMSMIFKGVTDDLKIRQKNLRDLILIWVDERRSYKRRLYNKKLSKISARISLLDVLIELMAEDKINRTIQIIRGANEDQVIKDLMKFAKMNSYQAEQIANTALKVFNKQSREKFVEERKRLKKEKEDIMEIFTSEKRIDEIILDELDDMRKYAVPRRSEVVSAEGHKVVSNTNHVIVVTKQGLIKKLPYKETSPNNMAMGTFKDLDYPTNRFVANNMDQLLFFDSYGRFSSIPVSTIENTEMSNPGTRIFDFTKLNGEIIKVMPEFGVQREALIKAKLNSNVYLVTLTKDGMIKKTAVDEYMSLKNSRNIRAVKVKDGDQLIYAGLHLDGVKLMIYTVKGDYSILDINDISEQGKDTSGVSALRLKDLDHCAGISVIGPKDKYVVVVTAKGLVKKCELEFFRLDSKRGVSSYLSTLDKTDEIVYADGMRNRSILTVCTRNQIVELPADDIPTMTRKAKGTKLIPVPVGCNIITATVYTPPKK